MNKEGAKKCILGSLVATMFIGFGVGAIWASYPFKEAGIIPCEPFSGLIIAVIGLVVMFVLLEGVERAGYKLRVVTKEDKNEK